MALRIFLLLLCLFAVFLPTDSVSAFPCAKTCSQVLYKSVGFCQPKKPNSQEDKLVPFPSMPYPQRYASRLQDCIQMVLRDINKGLCYRDHKDRFKCCPRVKVHGCTDECFAHATVPCVRKLKTSKIRPGKGRLYRCIKKDMLKRNSPKKAKVCEGNEFK